MNLDQQLRPLGHFSLPRLVGASVDVVIWRVDARHRATWKGLTSHEFAEIRKNQYVRDQVMADIKERGSGAVAIDLLKKLLDKKLRKHIDPD